MRWSDTDPAYDSGDGPAQPVVDIESQEAADWDKEALWRERKREKSLTLQILRVCVCARKWLHQIDVCWRYPAVEVSSYPIFLRIQFSHLQWQQERQTVWRWIRTSRRMPSPRSEKPKGKKKSNKNNLMFFQISHIVGFTFLRTSRTDALAAAFSSCSSDRKERLVPSALVSAWSSSGPPLAWPFNFEFSPVLLSAIPHGFVTTQPTVMDGLVNLFGLFIGATMRERLSEQNRISLCLTDWQASNRINSWSTHLTR